MENRYFACFSCSLNRQMMIQFFPLLTCKVWLATRSNLPEQGLLPNDCLFSRCVYTLLTPPQLFAMPWHQLTLMHSYRSPLTALTSFQPSKLLLALSSSAKQSYLRAITTETKGQPFVGHIRKHASMCLEGKREDRKDGNSVILCCMY